MYTRPVISQVTILCVESSKPLIMRAAPSLFSAASNTDYLRGKQLKSLAKHSKSRRQGTEHLHEQETQKRFNSNWTNQSPTSSLGNLRKNNYPRGPANLRDYINFSNFTSSTFTYHVRRDTPTFCTHEHVALRPHIYVLSASVCKGRTFIHVVR